MDVIFGAKAELRACNEGEIKENAAELKRSYPELDID